MITASLPGLAPVRTLRLLAMLAGMLLWAQLATAWHLHAEADAPSGHAKAACELCIAHGAAAPPPAAAPTGAPPATPGATNAGQSLPVAAPARLTPHSPRAPPAAFRH